MYNKVLSGKDSNLISFDELRSVDTPDPSGQHHPIPHHYLVDACRDTVSGGGFEITDEQHALTHDGNRYFGMFTLNPNSELAEGFMKNGHKVVVGIRNSHDKSLSAGLVAGHRVMVCDNLAFHGEVTLARKHTRFAKRDIHRMLPQAVGRLGDMFVENEKRIESYQRFELVDEKAHDIIIKCLDAKVIPNADVIKVVDEYRNPKHEEFETCDAWSLFNAFTEVAKKYNPHAVVARTQRLHGVFDTVVCN
jgi:hypothetical protein